MDNLSPGSNNVPNLGRYKVIGAPCDILIPFKKRSKSRKLAFKIKAGRLLAVLSLKTFLVWIPAKKIVVKIAFIKLRERDLFKGKTVILKELLAREGVKLGLATESGSDLGNIAPEKPILCLKSLNASFKKEFMDFKFAKKLAKLIPKSLKKQYKSLSTTLN